MATGEEEVNDLRREMIAKIQEQVEKDKRSLEREMTVNPLIIIIDYYVAELIINLTQI